MGKKMTKEEARQLAKLICATKKLRDASSTKPEIGHQLSWLEAAQSVCDDNAAVGFVHSICASNYQEFFDWAERNAQ